MKITSKGQITLPQELRERFGVARSAVSKLRMLG